MPSDPKWCVGYRSSSDSLLYRSCDRKTGLNISRADFTWCTTPISWGYADSGDRRAPDGGDHEGRRERRPLRPNDSGKRRRSGPSPRAQPRVSSGKGEQSRLQCAPRRCMVVHWRVARMSARKKEKNKAGKAQPRASITFPPELYRTLEELAKQNKVSIAWVVRDAVEKYIAGKWPLLGKREGNVQA